MVFPKIFLETSFSRKSRWFPLWSLLIRHFWGAWKVGVLISLSCRGLRVHSAASWVCTVIDQLTSARPEEAFLTPLETYSSTHDPCFPRSGVPLSTTPRLLCAHFSLLLKHGPTRKFYFFMAPCTSAASSGSWCCPISSHT